MHIVFMNPQGNFDPKDSYLTEHPDFGGQLVYVKELAQAMAKRGHKIDIITRRIRDASWPEFSTAQDSYPGFEESLRIYVFLLVATIFSTKRNFGHTYQNLLTKCCSFTENINLTLSPPITQMADMRQKLLQRRLEYHFPSLAILWVPRNWTNWQSQIRIGRLK